MGKMVRSKLVQATAVAVVAGVMAPMAVCAADHSDEKKDPRRAGAAYLVSEANAKEDKKNENDDKRMADAYQPKGVELGSFLLLPQVELAEAYTNNLYATERGAVDEFYEVLTPEFRLQSRFDTHALNFGGKAEHFNYRTRNTEDHTDANVYVDGRLDVSSETEIKANLNLYSRHEDRSSPDGSGGLRPVAGRGANSALGIKTTQGRYTFGSTAKADRYVFDDGLKADGSVMRNSDRDRWEYVGILRGGYEMFPGYSAIVQTTGNVRRYDSVNNVGVNRDSNGLRGETGLGVDLSELVRGDFLVGYFHQDYSDQTLRDPSGFAVSASFNWTPTKLTLVIPTLERSVSETTSAGVSSLVRTSASLLVRHELARNIVLSGSGGVSLDDYQGTNQEAWTYDWRFKGTYAFSPEMYVGGDVAEKIKHSDIADGSYDQLQIMARFGLRL